MKRSDYLKLCRKAKKGQKPVLSPQAARQSASSQALSHRFLLLWNALGGPVMVPEHRFHPVRKWRFDWALPKIKVAIELDGGTWSLGRHTRGKGYDGDMDKGNAAVIEGWHVFHFTTSMIHTATLDPVITWVNEQLKSNFKKFVDRFGARKSQVNHIHLGCAVPAFQPGRSTCL